MGGKEAVRYLREVLIVHVPLDLCIHLSSSGDGRGELVRVSKPLDLGRDTRHPDRFSSNRA